MSAEVLILVVSVLVFVNVILILAYRRCVKREMEGEVNSIETYLKVIIPDLPGAAINFATWQVLGWKAKI